MLSAVSRSSLAIRGCRPVRTKPFPAWPHFAEDEIAAAVEVMRSGCVNYCRGEHGREFEREFANMVECGFAVTVSSGTAALELALRSLGIGSGDEVVVPSRTFVASASCVTMCGARPLFADIDRETQNISANSISEVLTPKTKAIIVVHLAGLPCEIEPILRLAKQRNLFVIEDCAQAQGATYNGRPVGSFGDAAAFSFCQDKIMTTLGEGGMLTTDSVEVWQRASAFRDHGRSDSSAMAAQEHASSNGFRWLHDSIGTNWRMTEVQAAVGRLQLQKALGWLKTRRAHARQLTSRLSRIRALRIPLLPPHIQPAWYRFYAFIQPDTLRNGWNRDRILDAINAEGVPCFVGSCSEVYLEKAFQHLRPATRLPVAQELGETSLAFLVHPTLAEADIHDTCMAIEKVMALASAER